MVGGPRTSRPLDQARLSGNHLAVIKKLLWLVGLLVALTTLANVACGPKEKFCPEDPQNGYHCRPPEEDSGGFGGDGGQTDPCDGAVMVVRDGGLVCNF
jgi:hypothetical protein